MTDSKTAAAVVALRALGYPVTERGTGALIVNVVDAPDVPVKGLLAPGDVITMVDGVATPLATTAIEVLQKRKPGESVSLTVVQKSDGATVQKTIKLGTRTETSCTSQVIDPSGTVRWVSLTESFMVRARPEDVLKALDAR